MSAGLYRKQYEALGSIAEVLGVDFETPDGSFNEKFCKLCQIITEELGGTFEPIKEGSFSTRKAAYLKEVAITIGATVSPKASTFRELFLRSAKAIWDHQNDGVTPDFGSSLDWRVYQFLLHAAVLTPPAQDELIQHLYDYSGDFELLDKVDPQVVTVPDVVGVNVSEFDGTQAYSLTDPLYLGDKNYAIRCKVKPSGDPIYDPTIYADWETGNLGVLMRIDTATSTLEYRWNDGAATSECRSINSPLINDDAWHDCLIIKAETCVNLYTDGELGYGIVSTRLINNNTGVTPLIASRPPFLTDGLDGRLSGFGIEELPTVLDLHIMAGQSNMSQLPTDPDFAFPSKYGTTGKQVHRFSYHEDNDTNTVIDGNLVSQNTVGPDVFLGERLTKDTGRQHAVIRCAQGGADMASFSPGGARYEYTRDTINETVTALEAKGYTIGDVFFYYHQGEADSGDLANVNAWKSGFYSMVDGLQNETGLTFKQCVIGRLCDGIYAGDYVPEMRVVQVDTAESRGYEWIDTDSFELQPDNLHFTAAGFSDWANQAITQLGTLITSHEPNYLLNLPLGDTPALDTSTSENHCVSQGADPTIVSDDEVGESDNLRFGHTPALYSDGAAYTKLGMIPDDDTEITIIWEEDGVSIGSNMGLFGVRDVSNVAEFWISLNILGGVAAEVGSENTAGPTRSEGLYTVILGKDTFNVNGTEYQPSGFIGAGSITKEAYLLDSNGSGVPTVNKPIRRFIWKQAGEVVMDLLPLREGSGFLNTVDGAILPIEGGTATTVYTPAKKDLVDGVRVDAKYGLPIAVKGSVDGAREHNGCEVGFRATDAWFSDPANIPNVYHDGTNPIDRYYSDIVAHPNGKYGMYQKSEKDTGTLEMCILKEDGQYPTDWAPTPAQYTQGLKYWTVCYSFADPLEAEYDEDGTIQINLDGSVELVQP